MIDYIETNSTIRIFNKSLNEYRWMTNKRTFIKSEDNTVSFMYTLQDVNENKLLENKNVWTILGFISPENHGYNNYGIV